MPVETTPSTCKPDVAQACRFRFGVFEVDSRANEIRKHGLRIKLQDKPFHLLILLLERAGDVVTREELRRGLWPADTFVDFDANLKTSLNKLRHALGDSAENPTFIETVPRQGYRFLASVVSLNSESASSAPKVQKPSAEPPYVPASPAPAPRRYKPQSILGIVVLTALIVTALLIWPRFASRRTPIRQRTVLLVLPFDNLSGDATQEYFSDGLTDEMITQLGRRYADGLSVVARTSAMRYKGTHAPLPQISRELGGVEYVLEGSVRRSGNRVDVNAQLFRAQDQTSLWAETYESKIADMVSVQQEVSGRIARSLVLRLAPVEPGHPKAATNPKAYDAYLMGLYEANQRTRDGLKKSIEHYGQAISLDPNYAPAYAGLADSYLVSAGWLTLKPSEAYPKARAAAKKALDLDKDLAEAHTTLAEVEHEYEWKWTGAEQEYQEALRLNPNSANGHKSYAEFLMHSGKNTEAIAEIEKARNLDPLSLIVNSLVGFIYFNAQQYDRAAQECRNVIQIDPQFAPAHYFLGATLLQQRHFEDAITQFKTARDLATGSSLMAAGLARAYAVAGRREEALRSLRELELKTGQEYVSAYGIAQVYAVLGDKSRALMFLQQAADERAFELMFLKIDHSFDQLRELPRFQELIQKIGFPQ